MPEERIVPDAKTQSLSRRAAVVALADIVGWSVLAKQDEVTAVSRWLSLLHEMVTPAAHSFGGRVIDVQGDGVFAEFPSVDAALKWGRILHEGADRESQGSSDQAPITFRVAIHAGMVMEDGARLFGNTVNLLARLQEFGTPGGILLSVDAAAQLPLGDQAKARSLGELPLRNLSSSVAAVSLDPERDVGVPLAPVPSALPSIAVLPLLNLAGNPQDDYLAAGIAEDIASAMAGLHEVFVVATESARMFAGQRPTPQRVGRTLGVQFIARGNFLRSGGGLFFSMGLFDTRSGEQIWGERIDAAEREILDVQEYVVGRVVAGIVPGLRAVALRDAMRKRPENLTAYDHMLRGIYAFGSGDPAEFLDARQHLEQAIDLDPGFALPRAWAAYWHNIQLAKGLSSDRDRDTSKLFSLSEEALRLNPREALALSVLGHNLSFLKRDYPAAQACFSEALDAAPSSAATWTFSSATLAYLGQGDEAVAHAERGIRLSPYDPLRFYRLLFLGIAHYAAGNLDQCRKTCLASLGSNPRHAPTLRLLAAAEAGANRHEDAREAARRMMDLDPTFRLRDYASHRAPFTGSHRERFLADLTAAGFPA